jgi:hypothetical protein
MGVKGNFLRAFVFCSALLICTKLCAQQTFYVATNGIDAPTNGGLAAPWATITYALDRVPDGSTILVRPGTYTGRIRIRGSFAAGVTVKSELPYQAKLRAQEAVLTIYNDAANIEGISIEGFDIAHNGAGAGALVVQIQDGAATETRRIRLIDNILHDSFNNDILKINNGASNILVRGNLFYNQTGSDEHIDINSVDDVIVEDNIFFNCFSCSNRSDPSDTASFVVVKDSNATDDEYLGARNVTIRRNIMLNWQGSIGSGFLLFGEDGTANFEAFTCLVENNLLLGNSTSVMRSPLGVKGSRDITFRHNTIVGNLPANAFATRINREGSNPQIEAVRFVHNIFSDPTGSMTDFADALPADVSTARPAILERNLYFNGSNALPNDSSDVINITNDATRVTGDPLLADNSGLTPPAWQPTSLQFVGGYGRIRDVFVDFANRYGRPGVGSGVINAASVIGAIPDTDLLGNVRSQSTSDLGALQRTPVDSFFANGFE